MSTSSDSSVIVVGAGVIGLATAVELAARGFKVTVLDPAPASGASHYAGGMLAPAAEVVAALPPPTAASDVTSAPSASAFAASAVHS